MPSKPIITIDGHSAAGKSTHGKYLAAAFGLDYLHVGRFFRIIAHQIVAEFGSDPGHYDQPDAPMLARAVEIAKSLSFETYRQYETVNLATPVIDRAVSLSSKRPEIERIVQNLVKTIAATSKNGMVVDGRGMGVEIPEAILKLFLTGDPAIRAERRTQQLGYTVDAESLRQRDRKDETINPLAADALVIDVTKLAFAADTADKTTINKETIFAGLAQIVDEILMHRDGLEPYQPADTASVTNAPQPHPT